MRNKHVLSIGEVLWDNFPGYRRLGGAPFNFAVHLKNFGARCYFASRLGNDTEGKDILKRLDYHGLDLSLVQIDHDHPTGTVTVALDEAGTPSFSIHKNVAYDYLVLDNALTSVVESGPGIIYFGTLAQRSERGFAAIQSALSRRPAMTRSLCDINLRPGCYSPATVRASLESADILKLNDDELREIKKILGITGDEGSCVKALFSDYGLELIALTRGAEGAEIITPSESCSSPAPAVSKIEDTVGAGDAFASMLALGVINSWPARKILGLALVFASRICGVRGAIPEDRTVYDEMMTMMEDPHE